MKSYAKFMRAGSVLNIKYNQLRAEVFPLGIIYLKVESTRINDKLKTFGKY